MIFITPENYAYRNSLFFLRNDFIGENSWHMPEIPKAKFSNDDFLDLRMIGFDKAKTDETHFHRIVHFYLYDYKFESVWKKPSDYTEKLKNYKAILTPDFSMYLEMHPLEKLHNVFRNRWTGAYYASKGIKVIPTVSWGEEDTFDYCFEGIPKGSTVSVSTYMVSEHGSVPAQKEFFLKGYNEMLKRIEPERILCYNKPFPEMQGNIIIIDYDESSWRHMEEDAHKSFQIRNEQSEVEKIFEKIFDRVYNKGTGSAENGTPYVIFRGQRVFINFDIIELDAMTPDGVTNRELMKRGRAPYGRDGYKIHLHHENQKPDGNLHAMTQTYHNNHSKELHPFGNRRPSQIDRGAFRNYRESFWRYIGSRWREIE